MSGTSLATSSAALGAIEDALRSFAKALRAMQLYLPNNPTRAQAIEQSRAAFARVWEHESEFSLTIREAVLLCDGNEVYEDIERGAEGLPWLLHRDGLRLLKFREGFESADLEALLSVLQRARSAAADEDDLVTMLWVADLEHVQHQHVEINGASDFTSGITDRASSDANASAATPLAVPSAESTPVGDGPPPGLIRVEDYDSTLYFLEAREVTYLRDELKREYAEDPRQHAFAVLFDILELPDAADAATRTLGCIDQLLIESLAIGDYENVGYALREAASALRRADFPALIAHALRDMPSRLSEAAVMEQLLERLDDSARAPNAPLLDALFAELQPAALTPLVAWLGIASPSPARVAVERASLRLAGTNTSELARLLEHPNTTIVRSALKIAAQLATPAAVPGLSKVLRSDDATLRTEAVLALADIGSPGALQALERGVDDSDRDVRTATYRAIAARKHAGALPRIAQALRRKELRTADLGEKVALLDAYGTLCGDAGVQELDAILNARGLLGAKEPADLRACAARALGLVGTPNATEALQRAADAKDVVIRSAVSRALRGGA